MSLETNDNTSQASSALRAAIEAALDEVGSKAVGYAKANVHVVTGNLRDSIGYSADDKEVTVYASASYAADEELGNSHQDAHPYLRPSVNDHLSEYTSIIENKMKGIL